MPEASTPPSPPPLVPVADGFWTVDGGTIEAGGMPLPVRMTVIRLGDGALLLHSPVQFDPALHRALDALGPVRHLVAPGTGHWMFLGGWQRACPGAKTWGVPGLRDRAAVRASAVRIDADLGPVAPAEWAAEIDHVLLRGPGYAEVALFHRPSGSLLVTDLVINLDVEGWPPLKRLAARALRIAAPHGATPLHLRALLSFNRARTAEAAARLVAFQPRRVIPCHGRPFTRDAAHALHRALGWLLGPPAPPYPAPETTPMRKPLEASTVVITGASSGIGRAAALAFARRGARVVLAARRADLLEEVARQCEALGGRALAVETDVTDADAVKRLAHRAEAAFGSLDVWINNAGVGVFGPYADADVALHRRTVEVNLIGAMHGVAAVLPLFKRQGRGVIINTISMGGWAPTPFAAAYTASKFGLRGFTASLRQELEAHEDIHVCGVFPAMVDTPGLVHGANVSGHVVDPGPFVYRPEDVADTFVSLVGHPRGEVAVGWPARAAQVAYGLAPRATELAMGAAFRRLVANAGPAPRTAGALLRPVAAGREASGGYLDRKHLPGAGEISKAALVLGGTVLALALVMRRNRRRSA